ncbi:MAG: hypothetical protein RMA76_43365 [Deltaproteobacteria bacterium]|jgi:chromosome segregation ATPase
MSTALLVAFGFSLLSAGASAQVYKFKKKDGTIVYTDSLAQLPSERRAYYNNLERDRAERLRKIEKARGKDSVESERMKAERQRLLQAKIEEEERQRRIQAIDLQLEHIRERRKARAQTEEFWRNRVKSARQRLKAALAEFDKEQKTYNAIAIKGGYGLLPGQQKQMDDAKKKMDALEKEIDELNHELTVAIPEEARKASVPPGWIR